MYQKVRDLIDSSGKIVLVSHIAPDGDALGSSLAFYLALKKMGKNVKIYNKTEEISQKYDFLSSFSKISSHFPINVDLVISFDCGSFKRLGIERGDYKVINIDHHKSNELYGDIDIVDPSYASTSAVVFEILEELEIEIGRDIALCIYTALAEDTNFFTDSTTNEQVFKLATKLVKLGAKPDIVGKNLTRRNSLAYLRLEAMFINEITLVKDGKVAIGFVDKDMLKKSGALRYDTAHLADVLQSLATVKLSIFALDMPDDSVKFSLRSEVLDVSKIALLFGGGGHSDSAGFSVKIEQKDETIKKILGEINL